MGERGQKEEEKNIQDVSVDELLDDMGPIGRFQIFLLVTMFLAVLSTSYNFMVVYFTAHDPPWQCVAGNSSRFCSLQANKSIDSSMDVFEERCKLRRSEWTYTKPKHYSIVTEFDLVCENTATGAFATSAAYFGGILGSLVSGAIADRFGRKLTIILSLVLTTICSFGYTFVNNIWLFTALNITNGAGIVGAYFTAIIILLEMSPPKYRALFSTIGLFASTTSFFVIDFVAYFIREWRLLIRYMTISTAIATALSFFIPESPRWLLTMGKKTKAAEVVEKINRMNGSIERKVELKSIDSADEKKYTYLDIFKNLKVILLTSSVGSLWITIPIVEYFIALESSSLGGNMYQSFAFSTFADVPAAVLCTYLCDRFGRKKPILGGVFGSGILVGIVGVIPQTVPHRYIINIIFMTLARFVVVTSFFGIYIWTLEIYPTVLRSQGMAICAASDRLGIFAVPFIVKVLSKVNHILPYVLICVLAILASCFGLILPETNKLPTREKFEDFFKSSTPQNKVEGYYNSSAQESEDNV